MEEGSYQSRVRALFIFVPVEFRTRDRLINWYPGASVASSGLYYGIVLNDWSSYCSLHNSGIRHCG